MTLKESRIKFSNMVSLLLDYMRSCNQKYALTYCKRCENCPVGSETSLHKKCLAVDIDLYDDNLNYLTDSEAHRPYADYWKSIGGSSGIDWHDGNHYSLEFEGMK